MACGGITGCKKRVNGTPGGIRTADLLVRRQSDFLYAGLYSARPPQCAAAAEDYVRAEIHGAAVPRQSVLIPALVSLEVIPQKDQPALAIGELRP